MTFLGKILVIIICVMSLVFMGFAVAVYSTQTNWRDLALERQDELRQANERARALESELKETRGAFEKRVKEQQDDIAGLQAEIEDKNQQLADLDQQIAQVRREAQDNTQQAEVALAEATARREEALQLRATLKNVLLEKDEAIKKQVELQDNLFQVSGELERTENRNKELLLRVAELEQLTRLYDIPNTLTEREILANPPKVEGLVVRTNFEQQEKPDAERLVEISIGSQDGLIVGHQLHAWHPGPPVKYLGQIEVVETYPNRSVARILGGFKLERQDRVATRLQ